MARLRTILQCPKCGAMLAFENSLSNLKECTCGAVVQKTENELKLADGLNVATVKGYQLKPGSTGRWNDNTFTVLGKMGVWFEESFFSYWCIVFSNEKIGWLAEGYGMYSILLPEEKTIVIENDLRTLKVGQVARLSDCQLQKKNSSYYWEVEGEIYLKNYSAYFEVYEFASEKGMLYTIFQWKEEAIVTYNNYPVSFDALQLKNIQQNSTYGTQLKCPQCFKEIKLVTYPLAQSCTCNSCGNFYAIEKKQPVKKGNNKNNLFEPLLVLGTKGILKNIAYEVTGYAQKEEQNAYASRWREYTLFNPTYGFAFLSEFDGHWIYVKETITAPVILNDNIKAFELEKETFHLFNSYTYTVVEAKGEFPYNIFDNKNTLVKEYISPPEIWIREKDSKEGISWYFGEHIEVNEIKKAFPIKGSIPYRIGIGAVQPTGYISIKKMLFGSIACILLLLLVHMLFLNGKSERVIAENSYYFTDSINKIKSVTEKFDLDKWRSNLTFNITAPVSNSWFELNATLVNANTGKEYTMEQGVEYYYGYSDGENWTEGSRNETAYMTNLPAGKYFLEMEGTRDSSGLNKLQNYSVKVVYDGASYRNFWLAVLLLLVLPLIQYVRNIYSEKSRWLNSPFSNYGNN
jgi:hypothetical protein